MRPLFLLALPLLFSALPAAAQDTIQLRKYAGNLKQVSVQIGDSTYQLLFDTGGGETFFSPRIAAALNRPVYGEATTFRMSGEPVRYRRCDSVSVRIGRRSYAYPSVAVWDLMSILPAGLPRIDGVLSLKSFDGEAITLDLAHDRLIVETRASLKRNTRAMTGLESRFATGPAGNELGLFLRIPRNGRSFWFLFDSGNLRNVLLSPATAKAWGMVPDTAGNVANEPPIDLGGRSYPVTVSVEPIIYDGALNFALLRNSVFTIDLLRRRVWIH